MLNKILWIIAAGIVAIMIWPEPEITYGPGVRAPKQPLQTNLSNASGFKHQDYTITPLANFSINAKVLSRENYYSGREADLSPVDFALGWGRMSDESILQHFDISQRNRWYYWRSDNMPIPRNEISSSSANMHLIPANNQIKGQLARVKKGQVISLKGKLVKVNAADGWRWQSSLSRTDTGDGACELIWVESIRVH
ncbi:hypothetical protein [Pleionea sediminis]|uniref:hypothetical protein n=1 Tax=Pleionea sediminis TaxID=2569479 RepID=UPI0011850CD9|nr:hypothetical protein [Pleionea sediminis]